MSGNGCNRSTKVRKTGNLKKMFWVNWKLMLIGEDWEKFSIGLYVVRYKNTWSTALAGAAQSVECGPENQRVAG